MPSQGIFFDAGVASSCIPRAFFVTHSHLDHSSALPRIVVDVKKPSIAYVPQEAAHLLRHHLESSMQLNLCSSEAQVSLCDVSGVVAGQEIALRAPGLDWKVRVVECVHRVPSVGYCVSERRSKLLPKYQGLSGSEIGALRRSGVEISESVWFKSFAFMGDTTTSLFEKHPEVFEYSTLFVECTLFGEGLEGKAQKTTHVHWSLLKPFVLSHPHCHFMLIHFSLRWSEPQLREFFAAESRESNIDRKSTRLNSSHRNTSRMPSSA